MQWTARSCVLIVFLAALSVAPGFSYQQVNLVSSVAMPGVQTDPQLINPWGIAMGPTSPAWVSDNGTGLSTIYNGFGTKLGLVVTIPPPAGSTSQGTPTGIVFNGVSTDFHINASAATFILATEDGVIAGWNGAAGTTAIRKVDNSASGAVYKGLAIGADRLFATDFANNKVDAFDSTFAPASLLGTFTDPNLPAGFAPFGIQNINGSIFVSYAKKKTGTNDDESGPGNGFVNVFNTDGVLQKRLVTQGSLNSPWGMALAPSDFGPLSDALLVGNFGDGAINGFDPLTGAFIGQMNDFNNSPIIIDGLWGIAFGNGANNQPTNSLFFASGPNDEAGGLYGRIDPAIPEPASTMLAILGLTTLAFRRRR